MNVVWMIVATAFVLVVLGLIAYGLLELASGRHPDRFRDPRTGRRRWDSPHLEMRDEFEQTHDTGSPHLEGRDEFEHGRPGLT